MTDDGPISFSSSVRAEEMTFHDVRDDQVTFHGDAGSGTWAGTRREGLPDEVTPGVTYRQVRVDFRIATELDPRADPIALTERPPRPEPELDER